MTWGDHDFARPDGKEDTPHHVAAKTSNNTPSNVPFKERVKHLTWANFTLPMSTGGLALLLGRTPHQFPGLNTIGKIVYVLDLVIFVILCIGIVYRFSSVRGGLVRSLLHPTESLFLPTFFLASVNVMSGMQLYGVPACGQWLVVVLRVLFWLYVTSTFIAATTHYFILFTATPKKLTIQSMTPGWILPAFSPMLAGTLATIIAPSQSPNHRMSIVIAGITLQGFGWSVAFLMYAVFLHRLMQYGLPTPNLRPGMFIAVGPPSFTAIALIGLSNVVPTEYGYFVAHPTAAETLRVMALFIGIFLWTLAFWFFCIAALSVLAGVEKMSFHLIWWALVFPNVGFTLATSNIGEALNSPGILWLASAMTILLVCMWIFVIISQIRAIVKKQIMMPGKDEDKDQYKEDDFKHGIAVPP